MTSAESNLPAQVDAAIVGAGHNGLVAAAYLARAGLRVAVIERRELVGGACVTEELIPGYRFSRAAYVTSLFRPEIIRELELERLGLELLPRQPSSFTPLIGGGHLFLGSDLAENQREIARFSPRDAEAYPRYEQHLDRLARFMEPFLDEPPPDTAPEGASARLASLTAFSRIGLRALKMRADLPALFEVMTAPARRILDAWFESEPLRGTLGTDAIIGAMASPSTPGSGYVLFHHVMGETNGARGVWAYVRGGMGTLSEAIRRSAESRGVVIQTGDGVAEVLVENERAVGVRTASGREVRARVVLSNADPHVTFRRLVPEGILPGSFRRQVESLDFRSPVTKINVALDRAPRFAGLSEARDSSAGTGPELHGTIHLASTLDEVERAYADAERGIPSERPVIEMTIPSSLDDSLAPHGKHVASLFVQYTPYELADGSWDEPERREAFADRVFAVVEEYAPGFTASVVGRDILTPPDLERTFGLTGGNIFHGAMGLDQLFWLRPAAGWARYRTPLRGLYLCGAGAHPGGGVLGAPGRNSARSVLRDIDQRIV